MMKEAGSFFAIAMLLLILCVGYIYSQGGSPFALAGGHISQPAGASCGAADYRCLARADAVNADIDPDSFSRQIAQESGFNPSAVSPAGAIGISQIMPATAAAWNVDPWNATDSLRVAAQHMAWYYHHYGSYAKALSAYNAGSSKLDYCIANYSDWLSCMPDETQRYVAAIGG